MSPAKIANNLQIEILRPIFCERSISDTVFTSLCNTVIMSIMPISSEAAFVKLVELIQRSRYALIEATFLYYNEIIDTIDDKDFSDGKKLKEIIKSITDQMSCDLSNYYHEIMVLKERVDIRQKYPQLTGSEFEEIVNCEWSIALVQRIHANMRKRESKSLEEVSKLIKDIKRDWSKLRW